MLAERGVPGHDQAAAEIAVAVADQRPERQNLTAASAQADFDADATAGTATFGDAPGNEQGAAALGARRAACQGHVAGRGRRGQRLRQSQLLLLRRRLLRSLERVILLR